MELSNVADLAELALDWIHGVGEFAGWVLLGLRIVELVLRIVVLLRELFCGGRKPRKRIRTGRGARRLGRSKSKCHRYGTKRVTNSQARRPGCNLRSRRHDAHPAPAPSRLKSCFCCLRFCFQFSGVWNPIIALDFSEPYPNIDHTPGRGTRRKVVDGDQQHTCRIQHAAAPPVRFSPDPHLAR